VNITEKGSEESQREDRAIFNCFLIGIVLAMLGLIGMIVLIVNDIKGPSYFILWGCAFIILGTGALMMHVTMTRELALKIARSYYASENKGQFIGRLVWNSVGKIAMFAIFVAGCGAYAQ